MCPSWNFQQGCKQIKIDGKCGIRQSKLVWSRWVLEWGVEGVLLRYRVSLLSSYRPYPGILDKFLYSLTNTLGNSSQTPRASVNLEINGLHRSLFRVCCHPECTWSCQWPEALAATLNTLAQRAWASAADTLSCFAPFYLPVNFCCFIIHFHSPKPTMELCFASNQLRPTI